MTEAIAEAAIGAAGEVFDTMMKMKTQAKRENTDAAMKGVSVCGIISLVCEKYKVSTIIHFPGEMAVKATAAMLGLPEAEIEDAGDDVKDAVGEIANMVAGRMKNRLLDNDLVFEISLPSVISGHQYEVENAKGAQHFRSRLDADAGTAWLDVYVREEAA